MPITFEHVSHVYMPDSPFRFHAINDVNLTIQEGKITALIGHTGSGKSTLVQHLNALLLPTSGKVDIQGFTIEAGVKTKHLKTLRGKVGLVFQFPEYQLFEETVLKDVAFGPKNFNQSEEMSEKLAKEALNMVGLGEEYYQKSPLELSGGQKRRVAIAGILAMKPDVLVLDEPTAGLDPLGAKRMMDLFAKINRETKTTLIIVSHDMEFVYRYCDEVIVMNHGEVEYTGNVHDFFHHTEYCEKFNIVEPAILRLQKALKKYDIHVDSENLDDIVAKIKEKKKA